MSKRAYIRGNLKKSDFLRVLLTDTSPYEVPVIASNDGFYLNMRSLSQRSDAYRNIVKALILNEKDYSIPFRYNIKKDEKSVRQLSLPHPRHQVAICRFYEKYSTLIPHYCSMGQFSIRRPAKVGSSFFFSAEKSDLQAYRNNSVDTQDLELFVRNPASFYSYEGVSRLYKFFSSPGFSRLEKKYDVMVMLDVSKCFDSIYTHTMGWAVKDIRHAKENTGDSSFSADFDRLMQRMNYNETNGICIGPETSRIFAEIILNHADVLASQVIKNTKLRQGVDYDVYRYVDDYILFARKQDYANTITAAIEEGLRHFNLHINGAKTEVYNRPLVTPKGNIISRAKARLSDIFDTVLEKTVEGYILPKKLHRPSAFTRNFINAIKDECFSEGERYDALSNYVIASVTKRVERLCRDFDDAGDTAGEVKDNYASLIDELLEVVFFFYTTNPTVASSFDLSRAIIVADRFFKKNLSSHILSFAELVHRNIRQLVRIHHLESITRRHDMVPIEFLNVILASSELVSEAHAEEDSLVRMMFNEARRDYHSIVACLYYVKNRSAYSSIRGAVVANVESILGDFGDILKHSHNAHLALDILSCPYVPTKVRKRILNKLRVALQLPKPSSVEVERVLGEFLDNPWFVQWRGIDLLRMIRKKELSAVY